MDLIIRRKIVIIEMQRVHDYLCHLTISALIIYDITFSKLMVLRFKYDSFYAVQEQMFSLLNICVRAD